MKFYRHLYWGDSITKNKSRIKRKLRTNAGQIQIYVITLASGTNQLEIYHCAFLQQKFYKENPPYIVGIASGYDEALELLEKIVQDVWNATKSVDIKEYIRIRK